MQHITQLNKILVLSTRFDLLFEYVDKSDIIYLKLLLKERKVKCIIDLLKYYNNIV